MKDNDIKVLIQKEVGCHLEKIYAEMGSMRRCFDKTGKQVDRIERLLIGDEQLKDEGYAEMIRCSYEHTKRCEEYKTVDRLERVLKHFESWDVDGRWKVLGEIVDKYKIFKWITAVIVSSGLVSVANVVGQILELMNK